MTVLTKETAKRGSTLWASCQDRERACWSDSVTVAFLCLICRHRYSRVIGNTPLSSARLQRHFPLALYKPMTLQPADSLVWVVGTDIWMSMSAHPSHQDYLPVRSCCVSYLLYRYCSHQWHCPEMYWLPYELLQFTVVYLTVFDYPARLSSEVQDS